jgi:hypothetical protein
MTNSWIQTRILRLYILAIVEGGEAISLATASPSVRSSERVYSVSRLDNLRPHSFLVPTVTPFCCGLELCRLDSLSSYLFRSLVSPDRGVLSVRVCGCVPVHVRCAPPSRGDAARN